MAGLKGGVVAALRLPGSDPEAWNTILIGGQRAPGKVEVRGPVERKIDVKESPGSEVFSLTDKGAACAEIEIDFLLWTEEQAAAFGPIYAQHLSPRRPLAKRNVSTVVHPALYFAGIKQLFMHANTLPVPVGNPGQQVRVSCKGKEFNPKTQIGSSGSTKPKPAPSYAGQGGKWTTTALGSAPASYGPPTQAEAAARAAAAKAATAAPAPTRTLAEQQARAAKGDPQAAQVAATVKRVQP